MRCADPPAFPGRLLKNRPTLLVSVAALSARACAPLYRVRDVGAGASARNEATCDSSQSGLTKSQHMCRPVLAKVE